MEYTCHTVEDMVRIAPVILDELGALRTILLQGDLGAGKTTLVQAMCKALKVTDSVTSPTFALISEYTGAGDLLVYHIDLYRLGTLDEALNIGIEDYLDSGKWCFVEWPEIIKDVLFPPYAVIHIKLQPDTSRKIRILKVHAADKL